MIINELLLHAAKRFLAKLFGRWVHSACDETLAASLGIYAMAWNYHAYLPNQVEWIYLAPGSYVCLGPTGSQKGQQKRL